MNPQKDQLTLRIFSLVEFAAVGSPAIFAAVVVVAVLIGAAVYVHSA